MNKKSVAIAMSGGVDSSVAAALLVQQGYQVMGMTLRLWREFDEDANHNSTSEAISQAKKVASILNIPFYTVDARKPFYDSVVKYFLQSYWDGITPNPCLLCNREIKWGYLLKQALEMGADFLATGHYACIEQDDSNQFILKRGFDADKDQSYVLHGLTQTQLSHSIFPLGSYTKTDIRKIAHDLNLPVAEKEESQDLCFVATGDYRAFILRNTSNEIKPGLIVDSQGETIGQHKGLAFYTIGQRKGLGISSATPYYVLRKDIINNQLIVGKSNERARNDLYAVQVNWISGTPPQHLENIKVMVRYRSKAKPCSIQSIEASRIHIIFDEPINDITPGQAAVLYQGDVCLGGGIIL